MADNDYVGRKFLTSERLRSSDLLDRNGVLEIIAVHGLGSHREQSWSSSQKAGKSTLVSKRQDRLDIVDERYMYEETRPTVGGNGNDGRNPAKQQTPRHQKRTPRPHRATVTPNIENRRPGSTEKSSSWLQYIPIYVPNARVSTFGYDMEDEGISAKDINMKARELLDSVLKQDEASS
ncbi:hypothetical protein BGZ60DRAFT_430168 [Tricladium varicosporioides]|nr:hypothetical protein BGZ60DRAFT_430168 [Hymenoscyphus varicosporioides]